MLLIILTYLGIALYIGVVIGTFKKFKNNGVKPAGTTKLKFIFLPLIIFCLHLYWSIINLKSDYKFSLYTLKMGTLGYPVVIGIMIEIILEMAAQEFVEKNLVPNIKRKRNRMKVISKRSSSSKVKPNFKNAFNVYKKEVSAMHA